MGYNIHLISMLQLEVQYSPICRHLSRDFGPFELLKQSKDSKSCLMPIKTSTQVCKSRHFAVCLDPVAKLPWGCVAPRFWCRHLRDSLLAYGKLACQGARIRLFFLWKVSPPPRHRGATHHLKPEVIQSRRDIAAWGCYLFKWCVFLKWVSRNTDPPWVERVPLYSECLPFPFKCNTSTLRMWSSVYESANTISLILVGSQDGCAPFPLSYPHPDLTQIRVTLICRMARSIKKLLDQDG